MRSLSRDIHRNVATCVSLLVTGTGSLTAMLQPEVAQAANPVTYEVVQLQTLGGTVSYGQAINGTGQVVGYSSTAQGVNHATVWDGANGATPSDLGTMGGTDSQARGINTSGAIVGSATIGGSAHAFLYQNGSMTDIGTLGGYPTIAEGINDVGQIVGGSSTNLYHAFLYANGTMMDLGTLVGAGTYSYARAINSSGQIVGYSSDLVSVTGASPDPVHPFLWANGTMTDLLTGDAANDGRVKSDAYAINASGQAVGYVNSSTFDPNDGKLWSGANTTSLGGVTPDSINTSGDMVGSGPGGSLPQAVIWYAGATSSVSLKSLIDPASPLVNVTLTNATAINDDGWIVAIDGSTYLNPHAYLLVPRTLVVSSSSLSMAATVIANTSPAQSFTLTNQGQTALAISQISASGDFTQTNNCGSSVAAGASCTVNVTFRPTAPDSRTGQITVATATNSYVVAVSGTGTISVSLSAGAATATTGTSVTLSWNTATGSTCTATNGNNSDGWGGTLAASGSKSVVEGSPGTFAYSVQCTNGNQQAEAQTSVTYSAPVTAASTPPSSSSGGSGALGLDSIAGLLGMVGLRWANRRRSARGSPS